MTSPSRRPESFGSRPRRRPPFARLWTWSRAHSLGLRRPSPSCIDWCLGDRYAGKWEDPVRVESVRWIARLVHLMALRAGPEQAVLCAREPGSDAVAAVAVVHHCASPPSELGVWWSAVRTVLCTDIGDPPWMKDKRIARRMDSNDSKIGACVKHTNPESVTSTCRCSRCARVPGQEDGLIADARGERHCRSNRGSVLLGVLGRSKRRGVPPFRIRAGGEDEPP